MVVLITALTVLGQLPSARTEIRKGVQSGVSITTPEKKLARDILNKSLDIGKRFMLNNQKPEGNFNYEYDFASLRYTQDDNQVRQAGALWGLALIHQDSPSDETADAIEKGLRFFDKHSKETGDGRKYVVYPGDRFGQTGTVALLVLTLVDFLRSEGDINLRGKYERDLDKYVKFLISVRKKSGQFHRSYFDRWGFGSPSPYFDGESLLALIKAAKYAGRGELKEIILKSAEEMYKKNVEEALKKDSDSATTKGFYQWGSMAYYEVYTTGWGGVEKYAERVIDMAYWMIDVHKTLKRGKNTAYAHEGLVSAWEIARLTKNEDAMEKIGYVIDRGLYKLTSWQAGGPIENGFLRSRKVSDPKVLGGVMNGSRDSKLRIDVCQHQMHAVILARRFIYQK